MNEDRHVLPELLADRIERIARSMENPSYGPRLQQIELLEIADEVRRLVAELVARSMENPSYAPRLQQIELLEIADEVRRLVAELAELKWTNKRRRRATWWWPYRTGG